MTIPVESYRTSGGASVVRMDEDAARPVLNVFRGIPPDDFQKADVSVTVLNGSGVGRPGRPRSRDALDIVGFATAQPATADDALRPHDDRRTGRVGQAAADLLARHLTSGAVLEEDPSLGPGELLLITGTDFTTVMEQPGADDHGRADDRPSPMTR